MKKEKTLLEYKNEIAKIRKELVGVQNRLLTLMDNSFVQSYYQLKDKPDAASFRKAIELRENPIVQEYIYQTAYQKLLIEKLTLLDLAYPIMQMQQCNHIMAFDFGSVSEKPIIYCVKCGLTNRHLFDAGYEALNAEYIRQARTGDLEKHLISLNQPFLPFVLKDLYQKAVAEEKSDDSKTLMRIMLNCYRKDSEDKVN